MRLNSECCSQCRWYCCHGGDSSHHSINNFLLSQFLFYDDFITFRIITAKFRQKMILFCNEKLNQHKITDAKSSATIYNRWEKMYLVWFKLFVNLYLLLLIRFSPFVFNNKFSYLSMINQLNEIFFFFLRINLIKILNHQCCSLGHIRL